MTTTANPTPMTAPSSMTQLELPFDFSAMHSWTDSMGGANGLEFSVTLTPTGAQLRLTGPWPAEEPAAPSHLPLRGVLWQAQVDLAAPWRTVIAPAPDGGSRYSFVTRLPFSDCFTAPLAWAAELGQRQGLEQEGLLMAMRRSLVLVARHLESVQHQLGTPPSASLGAVAV